MKIAQLLNDKHPMILAEASVDYSNYTDKELNDLIKGDGTTKLTEDQVKSLNWESRPTLRYAMLDREDFSEGFLFKIVDSLHDDYVYQLNTVRNPTIYNSSKIMTNLTKKLSTLWSYRMDILNQFSLGRKTPIDKDLLAALFDNLFDRGYGSMTDLQNLTQHINFPDEAFDKKKVEDSTFLMVLSCPNASKKRVQQILLRFLKKGFDADDMASALLYREHPVRLSDKVAKLFLDKLSSTWKWFGQIITDDQIDYVLNNMNEYETYLKDEKKQDDPTAFIFETLSRNKSLTPDQKRRILDMSTGVYDNAANIMLTSNPDDESFFNELIDSGKVSIWKVWDDFVSYYHEFDKEFVKTIDKLAFASKKTINVSVLIGTGSFTQWVNSNNNEKMSNETGVKYLLQFIKYGDKEMLEALSKVGYINDEWLEYKGVKESMFRLTSDTKYVYGPAKNFFIFPE